MKPRTVVNATAALLIVAWLFGALAGYAWTWLPLVASCLFLTTGYAIVGDRIHANGDLHRAYQDARRLLTTNDHTIIERARDDILRRDPQAYPLQHRAVWPDGWSYE